MHKNLVIVESPAKAKTIEKYLGADFTVRSSFGHIRDLPKKGLAIDKEHGFAPSYEISADKKKVVSELKKLAKTAEHVWLATDEDREGEAIAWHLAEALKLDIKTTKRIVFHEITKPAILEAIAHPRTLDTHLVDAQQARRILDRLVGYELSPVLWKKVQTGLSAGRVQSVAVRLIVEREREIREFEPESSYKVTATFRAQNAELPAELTKKLPQLEAAQSFLEAAQQAQFVVASNEKKPGSRNPSAPFTTSTLQQEAARRLGFSVKQTMMLAQRLYENGHITYMRTDSTNLSNIAQQAMAHYIEDTYGKDYVKVRNYATKNSSAQEAHEAIRPTDCSRTEAGDEPQQRKLYSLIWQRALASQMTAATIERAEVKINCVGRNEQFIAKGEVLLFDGFLKVYGGTKDDVILPPLEAGDALDIVTMTAAQTFTKPAARYSEASLVKKLEELGIGRPSTYAPTISVVQARQYVEKADVEGQNRDVTILTMTPQAGISANTAPEQYGADRNKLLPTYLGEITTDFLKKYFDPIVDYDFTAKAEQSFDEIAEGKAVWQNMIAKFYTEDFHPLIEKSAVATRSESSQARELGTDPTSGKPVIARYGRYGAMLQIGLAEDDEKPRFAPMPANTTLETVTFEQALEMFKLPREVGTTEDGEPIKANIGRFGPYVQFGKTYVSIKEHDPLTITEAEARELIKAKKEADAKKVIHDFGSIRVLIGQYGPYITDGKKNARIPKNTDPAHLTEADCATLLEKAPVKKRVVRRVTRKK